MCLHFRAEMFEHVADRDCGGLAEAAVGSAFHFTCQIQERIQFFEFALSL